MGVVPHANNLLKDDPYYTSQMLLQLQFSDDPQTQGCDPNVSNCLPDGRYAPVQCKGDRFTGRCFCSDPKGRRIFGQMWRDQAQNMTCACSRRRAELEAEGKVVTLHCSANGDYEQLQCNSGMCWCAQARDGQPIVTPVHEEDMERLPCYCARDNMIFFPERGMTLTETCQANGNYSPKQSAGSVDYCVDSDGYQTKVLDEPGECPSHATT
ncbi:unnamed protein product [Spodoptera exigua]|nr:unnamed protein product [Spodoptera exigua]